MFSHASIMLAIGFSKSKGHCCCIVNFETPLLFKTFRGILLLKPRSIRVGGFEDLVRTVYNLILYIL